MNIFFGTDGWRAHIDTEINEETVSIAAQAFADFIHRDYKEKSPCVALAYENHCVMRWGRVMAEPTTTAQAPFSIPLAASTGVL